MTARDMTVFGAVATMTSLELVSLINSERGAGKSELRHDHFMVKIEKHPGIDSPKFLGQYKDATGRTLKCYNLPKRESELMVMSESLAVQTKVYDRMAELEVAPIDPLASLPADQRALVALMVDNAAIKAKQAQIEATQNAQQDSIKRLESNQIGAANSVQSFTAMGYSIYKEIPMSKIELTKLGRTAARISKERGITVDHVPDSRFGRVGQYHITALDAAVEEMTK